MEPLKVVSDGEMVRVARYRNGMFLLGLCVGCLILCLFISGIVGILAMSFLSYRINRLARKSILILRDYEATAVCVSDNSLEVEKGDKKRSILKGDIRSVCLLEISRLLPLLPTDLLRIVLKDDTEIWVKFIIPEEVANRLSRSLIVGHFPIEKDPRAPSGWFGGSGFA